MPPKPYVSMSIRRELYEKLERLYVLLNAKAGRRRFKSMQELLEYLVDKELKQLEEKEKESKILDKALKDLKEMRKAVDEYIKGK